MNSTLRSLTRLKPMSDKCRAAQPARDRCIAAVWKRAKGKCEEPGCKEPGHDVHETRPRSQGGDFTGPKSCALLCRGHHRRCHRNPKESYESGLMVRRFDSSGCEPVKVLPGACACGGPLKRLCGRTHACGWCKKRYELVETPGEGS